MRTIVEESMLGKAWVLAVDSSPQSEDNDLIRAILSNRGITESVEIQKFLNPAIKESMPDPYVLKDMDAAARIVSDAIIAGKKIAVFGDYDVDGITSTAIVVKYLRAIDVGVVWHLPDREVEGYGLNADAIKDFAEQGAEVLISVDCGISGVNEVALAKQLGMQVVITDHHNPDRNLPAADAIVNPKRADDGSGLNYLAGVGVAFMFLVALNRELRNAGRETQNMNLMDCLDLVALGTICDTMPLIGLNRAFVATGLKVLDLRQNIGLRALMEIAGVKKSSVYAAGFAIGPRLNAAGRLDSAAPSLELLLTDNVLIARDLAEKLNKMNQERMDIQNRIMTAAIDMADKCCASGKCSLMLCGDNWHGGVMGIIAGRLKDKYEMPSLVATKSGDVINGSGRSIPGVDLGKIIHDALSAGLLSEGGGHAAAAGFTLPAENETAFCEFLEAAVMEQLKGIESSNETVADAELDASAAGMNLVRELSYLAPFGQGNPEPLLILNGGTIAWASTMGNGDHIRGNIRTSKGDMLQFAGFNLTATKVGEFLLDDSNINRKIKLLGKLKENEYNGRVSAQFIIEDVAV
ncbi:MAG: single-stranded-DNA-specific exonuclease RecJ [Alphaproteobacteria bacterium]|nr:single-stranded-DNA-specific exonuclease RecJ [Alphaproteobacteria bacterium]